MFNPEGETMEVTKPKIPEIVDIKDTDPDRKELYGKAGEVFTEERRKALSEAAAAADLANPGKVFIPGVQAGAPPEAPPEPEKKPEIEVAEEDKRAFVRSLLADRSFEKPYLLFGGQVEVVLVDRTTVETDKLFDWLDKIEDESAWSQEADRMCLASTLREIKRPDGRNSYTPTDDWMTRLEELRKLPRPLYEALIETSRNFEALVNRMVEKARDPDFWPAGGNASQSRRTAGTR
jgi:hypothetical protein